MPIQPLAAPLYEIFSSAQGEGLLVGVRQLFVRVRGCDLACHYCDQPEARVVDGPCRVERSPGGGEFLTVDNPVAPTACFELLKRLGRDCDARHHSVAITGGEPLLYPEFINALSPLLREAGWQVYLETAGHRPEQLARVIECVDWVAMDVKLPSTLDNPAPLERFAASLGIARRRNAMLKLVITGTVAAQEVEAACQVLAEVDAAVPLVLQPVTAVNAQVQPVAAATLLELQALCQGYFDAVRIIPQCHRLVGVL